jgi:hypothetical protein
MGRTNRNAKGVELGKKREVKKGLADPISNTSFW